jgi:hypothetical protein
MCGEVLSFSPCSREKWGKMGRKRRNLVGSLVCLNFRMRNATVKFSSALSSLEVQGRKKKMLSEATLMDTDLLKLLSDL